VSSSPFHTTMSITCHRIRCATCIINYTVASYRIAGGSASSSTRGAGQGRRIGNLAQEVLEVEEQGEDIPECVDHQPSSFERGKPRSILSLLLYKSNLLYIWVLYIITLSYRSWVKPLMHLLLSLPTLLHSYLVMFRME
jgi:hypothetical protein